MSNWQKVIISVLALLAISLIIGAILKYRLIQAQEAIDLKKAEKTDNKNDLEGVIE
jgi:Tfp pilus assembly protein PilO